MAKQLEKMTEAPDFSLTDTNGQTVKLSDFRGKRTIVLVLMRGFV